MVDDFKTTCVVCYFFFSFNKSFRFLIIEITGVFEEFLCKHILKNSLMFLSTKIAASSEMINNLSPIDTLTVAPRAFPPFLPYSI